MESIDPTVELLADIPISDAAEDLFDRQRLAVRLAELAATAPVTAPRVIALSGACGEGKSSVLRMVSAVVAARPGLAIVSVDAQMYASAQALMAELAAELDKLFSELGVVDKRDKVRNTLVSYGSMISNVVRFAGVTVDVAGALERSAASLRAEIAHNLEHAGKRLVIVIDHLDRLPPGELGGAFAALRMYAAIPYIAIVIAVDRHELATRPAIGGTDPRAFERLVDIELVMPPADRTVLARVMAGGLERTAERMRRDLDPVLELFDPEDGVGLALIDTPRDAKRAVNALSAALPLLPPDANPYFAALELVLRVLVPELDGTRLATWNRTAEADRETLFAELAGTLEQHPRAAAARRALRNLIMGD